MSKKSEIIQNYIKKIDQLKKHNNLYFNKDNPEITDAKYDDLKKEINELEKKK